MNAFVNLPDGWANTISFTVFEKDPLDFLVTLDDDSPIMLLQRDINLLEWYCIVRTPLVQDSFELLLESNNIKYKITDVKTVFNGNTDKAIREIVNLDGKLTITSLQTDRIINLSTAFNTQLSDLRTDINNNTVTINNVSNQVDNNTDAITDLQNNAVKYLPDLLDVELGVPVETNDLLMYDGIKWTSGSNVNATRVTINEIAPTSANEATRKDYVDAAIASVTNTIGQPNGIVPLNNTGQIDPQFYNPSVMELKGVWDASLNNPLLVDGTGNIGDAYIVQVAGTQFTPPVNFSVGDLVLYCPCLTWKRVGGGAASTLVTSGNGTIVVNNTNPLIPVITTQQELTTTSNVIFNSATMTAPITNATQAATKAYVDTIASTKLDNVQSGNASTLSVTGGLTKTITTVTNQNNGLLAFGAGFSAANGRIPIGNGTSFTTSLVGGTPDEVVVTNGVGSITLSAPLIGKNTIPMSSFQVIRNPNLTPFATPINSFGSLTVTWSGTIPDGFDHMQAMIPAHNVCLQRWNNTSGAGWTALNYFAVRLEGGSWTGTGTLSNIRLGFTNTAGLQVMEDYSNAELSGGRLWTWTNSLRTDRIIYGRFVTAAGEWSYGTTAAGSRTGDTSDVTNNGDVLICYYNNQASSYAIEWRDSTAAYAVKSTISIASPHGTGTRANHLAQPAVPILSVNKKSSPGWNYKFLSFREMVSLGVAPPANSAPFFY